MNRTLDWSTPDFSFKYLRFQSLCLGRTSGFGQSVSQLLNFLFQKSSRNLKYKDYFDTADEMPPQKTADEEDEEEPEEDDEEEEEFDEEDMDDEEFDEEA